MFYIDLPIKIKWWRKSIAISICRVFAGCSYGHLPIMTGYFYVMIHSINGVSSVLITDQWPLLGVWSTFPMAELFSPCCCACEFFLGGAHCCGIPGASLPGNAARDGTRSGRESSEVPRLWRKKGRRFLENPPKTIENDRKTHRKMVV